MRQIPSIFGVRPRSPEVPNLTANSVNGTHISLSGEGTGDLIYFNGTDWVVLPPGTSGYSLKSNGAGVAPSYQATTGALALIANVSASADASVDFDAQLDATYESYLLVGTDIHPATDSVDLWLRTDSNSGASYDTGASDYSWAVDGYGTNAVHDSYDDTDSKINMSGVSDTSSNLGGAAAEASFLSCWINNPAGTTYNKIVTWQLAICNASGFATVINGSGIRLATAAIDSVQLLPSSGNISGEFYLYGLAIS